MQRSETRVLTTHVGSLPRVEGLADLLIARERGKDVDEALLERTVERAVAVVVDRQIACGIDIGNDGEMPRSSFSVYVARRMSGFGRGGKVERPLPLDAQKFPLWFDFIRRSGRRRLNVYELPQAIGEHGPWNSYDAFISGPPGLIRSGVDALRRIGIPAERIRYDSVEELAAAGA